jgi:hypothetical protein
VSEGDGRIMEAMPDGNLKIATPAGHRAEVGERFWVLDSHGQPVAEIKVIQSDSSGTTARYFQPFVSDDTLRTVETGATGGAVGAAVATGSALGTVLVPGLGTAVGAITGLVVANALSRRSRGRRIREGMVITGPIRSTQEIT